MNKLYIVMMGRTKQKAFDREVHARIGPLVASGRF